MPFARMGGRRDAPVTRGSKIDAINATEPSLRFYSESLPVDLIFRTVSSYFAPYRAGHQRFTVTLKVPTFPLLSKDLNEIVCSPGPSAGKSTE